MVIRIKLNVNENEIWFDKAPFVLKNNIWSYSDFYLEPEHNRTNYHKKIRRFFERMYKRYGKD